MKKTNFKRIILTVLALVLTLSMCFAVVGCGGDGDKDSDKSGKSNKANDNAAKETLEAYCKASLEDFDADATMDFFHDDVLEAYCAESDTTVDEYEESLEQGFELMKMVVAEGGVIEYDIVDNADFDETAVAEQFEGFGVEYDDCKAFTVKTRIEFMGETQEQEEVAVLVKIDGKWYMNLK